MKMEMPSLLHPILVTHRPSAGPSEGAARVAFEPLKSKLDNHYHHNPYVRGVDDSRTTGRIMTCCPTEPPPKLVLSSQLRENEVREFN